MVDRPGKAVAKYHMTLHNVWSKHDIQVHNLFIFPLPTYNHTDEP